MNGRQKYNLKFTNIFTDRIDYSFTIAGRLDENHVYAYFRDLTSKGDNLLVLEWPQMQELDQDNFLLSKIYLVDNKENWQNRDFTELGQAIITKEHDKTDITFPLESEIFSFCYTESEKLVLYNFQVEAIFDDKVVALFPDKLPTLKGLVDRVLIRTRSLPQKHEKWYTVVPNFPHTPICVIILQSENSQILNFGELNYAAVGNVFRKGEEPLSMKNLIY